MLFKSGVAIGAGDEIGARVGFSPLALRQVCAVATGDSRRKPKLGSGSPFFSPL